MALSYSETPAPCLHNSLIQLQIQIILLHYNVLHSQTEFDPYGNPQ